MTEEYLLRINIPPSLEEDFVDELLAMPGLRGYQSYPTRGHGQVVLGLCPPNQDQ